MYHFISCVFFIFILCVGCPATPADLIQSPIMALPHHHLIQSHPKPLVHTTIYFGYGSNLWLHQMDLRCPTSDYLGVARLNGYKWIINERGYANVVEAEDSKTESPISGNEKYENVVFGLVYSLQPDDEVALDKNEGVPISYTKEHLVCDFWPSEHGNPVDVQHDTSTEKKMLVYIDRTRITDSKPKKEYIVRMNNGIKDAIKKGVPEAYVKAVMRRFIPAPETSIDGLEEEEQAMRQAVMFVDDN